MKNAYFNFSGEFLYLASGDNQNVVHSGVIVVTVPDDMDVNSVYYDLEQGKMLDREPLELHCDRTVLAWDIGETATITGATPGSVLDINGTTEQAPDSGEIEVEPKSAGAFFVAPGFNRSGPACVIRVETLAVLQDELRTERNARLAATDWTQMPDVVKTRGKAFATKATEYRQALRDLLDTQPNATIDTVEWPDEPK